MEKWRRDELDKLRNELHRLIDKEKNLISPKVVALSQKLDKALNAYEKAKNKKNRID
ncbi:aspartyl-phosphate phosphatase Spo0E family protein [Clostridium formicaceticum]|uniref:Spo0E like sporulation regulatory protein n=1 Tax=Clostridium formicaceticum TaxID=1497 RepID=A0AAC9RM95_9CLOT|nr:aspartyl-phosphate phosphatase Spo0E family protein [Clostridium formicaceticum]ARE89811.1 Spo0E like sporulation regulatory protein [Clostridium formicaceticum]